MARPQVSLDPIARVLDRLLEHPAARVASEFLPETAALVRGVRDQLPALASELEHEAIEHVTREARELERELLAGARRFLQKAAARQKPKKRPPKRLKGRAKR